MTEIHRNDQPACPTCGGTGPDVFTYLYDEGVTEAACGDEWHDRFLDPPFTGNNWGPKRDRR